MYSSDELELIAEPKPFLGLKNNLARQFLFVASGVLLLGMVAQGAWVTRKIENGVTEVAAASAAVYINTLVAPHLQELASRDLLSPSNIEALNRTMARRSVKEHVTAINVWKEDGLIVYSTQPELVGRQFPLNPSPRKAWGGKVATVFDNLTYEEDNRERARGLHLLEIYTPVRDIDTGEVIAVLEFHERADTLKAQLNEAEWHSWAVTALITISMIGALFSIVADGSKMIDQQREALSRRVLQLSDLLNQNELLRARVQRAARSAVEDTERFMRQLGYDLHDGIAQLIGLALLRLDRVKATQENGDNLSKIHNALSDALTDIRNLCRGLLLPEIQELTLGEALQFMVRHHERRTGTIVQCTMSDLPLDAPDFIKITLCRFIQEGLNNAFRHGQGKDQRVSVLWDGKGIAIEVADEGPGMTVSSEAGDDTRLGMKGLWDRIESVGGAMTVHSHPGSGTRITAELQLAAKEPHGQ